MCNRIGSRNGRRVVAEHGPDDAVDESLHTQSPSNRRAPAAHAMNRSRSSSPMRGQADRQCILKLLGVR